MRRMTGLLLVAAAWGQDAWLTEAERKMSAGDYAGLVAACDKAIEGTPADPRAHAGRARGLLELGRYDEAFASIQRAIELAPKADAIYLHTRAVIRVARGDEAGALSDIKQALEVDPARGGLYLARGNISFGKHEYEAALRDYSKALELGTLEALMARASTRAALGDWKGAIEDYTRLADVDSSYPFPVCLRGDVRAMLGDWKGAIADYDAVIARKKHAPSYLGRASARFALGDREAADADAAKAVETCPCVECFATRGKYYYDTGRPREAAADLAKAVQMGPEWQEYTRLFLFLARARLGEREEAGAALLDFAADRAKDDWYAKVAAFLCGALKEEELLAAAKAENQHRARELECEACWYAGAVRLLDGDAAGAKVLFERCVATDARTFKEYGSARMALAAMK